MGWRNLLIAAMLLAASAAARAQAPDYNLGKTLSATEVQTLDPWNPIGNDGEGLPAGHGTALEGAKIFAAKCAMCHGANGTGGQAPTLTPAASGHPPFPIQVPFAPVIWDYIHRAMPMMIGPGTLKPDEVYSLTAYLLYKNNIIREDDVMDAQTLPKVNMPRRNTYVPAVAKPWKP